MKFKLFRRKAEAKLRVRVRVHHARTYVCTKRWRSCSTLVVDVEARTFASERFLGKPESYVIEKLGEPDAKPDLTYFYERKYGTLRIEILNGKVEEVGIHAKRMNEVELCR